MDKMIYFQAAVNQILVNCVILCRILESCNSVSLSVNKDNTESGVLWELNELKYLKLLNHEGHVVSTH